MTSTKPKEILQHLEAIKRLLETADEEVYQESKTAGGGLRLKETKYLLKILENGHDYTVSGLYHDLQYLLGDKKRIEGRLYKATNDRYVLDKGDWEFSSGMRIDVFVDTVPADDPDHGWNFGRVEHSRSYGGYYFRNHSGYDNYPLRSGMLVAVRV